MKIIITIKLINFTILFNTNKMVAVDRDSIIHFNSNNFALVVFVGI